MKSNTILYRYYAYDDTLLYVGITNDLESRMATHAKNNTNWDNSATYITLKAYNNRKSALTEETNAIKTEKPVYNISENAHNIDRSKKEKYKHNKLITKEYIKKFTKRKSLLREEGKVIVNVEVRYVANGEVYSFEFKTARCSESKLKKKILKFLDGKYYDEYTNYFIYEGELVVLDICGFENNYPLVINTYMSRFAVYDHDSGEPIEKENFYL